jgi:hypothetical protein
MKIYVVQNKQPKVYFTYEKAMAYARRKLKKTETVVVKEYEETNTMVIEKNTTQDS